MSRCLYAVMVGWAVRRSWPKPLQSTIACFFVLLWAPTSVICGDGGLSVAPPLAQSTSTHHRLFCAVFRNCLYVVVVGRMVRRCWPKALQPTIACFCSFLNSFSMWRWWVECCATLGPKHFNPPSLVLCGFQELSLCGGGLGGSQMLARSASTHHRLLLLVFKKCFYVAAVG